MSVASPRRENAGYAPDAPVLHAEALSKAYGPITVLRDVSLDIRAGEVHAIIGENGAGKATLMKLLSGHAEPTSGTLSISGAPVSFDDAVPAEDVGIVLVHQEILLAQDLTIAQNLFLGREISRDRAVDDRAMNRRTAEVLARVGSTARPTDRVRDMPLAQQQLLQIARALLDERKVVIMDEPDRDARQRRGGRSVRHRSRAQRSRRRGTLYLPPSGRGGGARGSCHRPARRADDRNLAGRRRESAVSPTETTAAQEASVLRT